MNPLRTITFLLLPSLGVIACGGSSNDSATQDELRSVVVTYDARLAGQPAMCNAIYPASVGTPAVDYRMVEYRWYASDFKMLAADGTAFPITLDDVSSGLQFQGSAHNVALLGYVSGCDTGNDSDAANFSVSGEVVEGDYTQVCFTLGVPFALNHTDVADTNTPSPLNLPAMNWNWRGGRKFVRFDGFTDSDQSNGRFNLHLGSTGCEGTDATTAPANACSEPNTIEYCFPLTPGQQYSPLINVDPARLLDEVDVRFNTDGTASGCQSFINDPECETVMPKYGLDYELNGTTVPARTPTLFQ